MRLQRHVVYGIAAVGLITALGGSIIVHARQVATLRRRRGIRRGG